MINMLKNVIHCKIHCIYAKCSGITGQMYNNTLYRVYVLRQDIPREFITQ